MKELYSQWLRIQCESWMKQNIPDLFRLSYNRVQQSLDHTTSLVEECLLSQVNVSIGPWLGVYLHFKEPGERMCALEKCNLSQLREQGNLVLIIRCLEDFETLMSNYFCAYIQNPAIMYIAKSA